ncbi:MAG TPA: BrnA antitoxin family protein [Candidatus Flavonifractor merdavium]|nr:BrnA antitoxin family protein [Candidatus Flavonifractor merdavium]
MKPLKNKVSLTLDQPVLEKIQKLAEQQDRSLSSYINLVLRAHLEALEHKTNP